MRPQQARPARTGVTIPPKIPTSAPDINARAAWSLPTSCSHRARFQRFNSNATKCQCALGGTIHSLPWKATRRRGRNSGGPRAVVAANHHGSSTGTSADATARVPPILMSYHHPSWMVRRCRGQVKPQKNWVNPRRAACPLSTDDLPRGQTPKIARAHKLRKLRSTRPSVGKIPRRGSLNKKSRCS